MRWGVPADGITVIDNGIDFARLAFSADARATGSAPSSASPTASSSSARSAGSSR